MIACQRDQNEGDVTPDTGSRPAANDGADRGPRRDAGQKQQLVFVHIADAGEVALVVQRLADGPLWSGQQTAYRFGRIPVRTEDVRAEMPDHGGFVGGPQYGEVVQSEAERLPLGIREYGADLVHRPAPPAQLGWPGVARHSARSPEVTHLNFQARALGSPWQTKERADER